MAQKTKSTGKKTSGNAKSSSGRKKTSGAGSKTAAPVATSTPVRREVGAFIFLFLGIFSFIGYFNVDAAFMNFFCGFMKALIGWGYYIFPIALLVSAFILFTHRGRPVALRVTCTMLLPLILGALLHILFSKVDITFAAKSGWASQLYSGGKEMKCGGFLSGLLGIGLEATFSVYGAVPLLLFAFFGLMMVSAKLSFSKISSYFRENPRPKYVPEPEPEPAAVEEYIPASRKQLAQSTPLPRSGGSRKHAIDIPLDGDEPAKQEYTEERVGFFNKKPRVRTPDQVLTGSSEEPVKSAGSDTGHISAKSTSEPVPASMRKPEPKSVPVVDDGPAFEKTSSPVSATENVEPLPVEEAQRIAGITPAPTPATPAVPVSVPVASPVSAPAPVTAQPQRPAKKAPAPVEDDVDSQREEIARAIEQSATEDTGEYTFPPLELLKTSQVAGPDSREEIARNRERLDSTLHSFGVNASIVDVTRGPSVTRYDLELEQGVKLNKLTNLAGDLALSLGVANVRIAPIPDKISTVGVEVPNKVVSTVYLRDIIGSAAFKNASSKLSFALGKDIGGNAIVGNISKLPHMLIAGTTGSGKSVCMNSIILSLLYKSTPDEVRLIMVDPKMVELGIYNGIPHLYIPVVTDPKKAAGALQWSVVEMLKRYRLFSEIGVRDLAGYNAYQKKLDDGQTLPQVVIVIDELADLMLVASKEVEESICRVAQMGRAAGMHLIIATQRPSSDVITGLMKANIPSRIAFAVSSALESRIILDAQGAEKLVGMGDMLYAPLGSSKPTRIQGAFVSDEEREEVINFIKARSDAQYDEGIIAQVEENASETGGKGNGTSTASQPAEKSEPDDNNPFADYDELLPQAVDVIFETKQASVSMLQRRLKLGYSRAARIVDQMEEIGVVGPFEGSKPRQIMITREQWLEMKMAASGETPAEEESIPSFADYEDDAPEDWEET